MAAHPLEKSIRKLRVTLDGKATDIVITGYSNAVMLIATQNGKCGTWVSAKRDASAVSDGEGNATYTVKTLLGKRDEVMIELMARALITKIANANKSLLMAINIKSLTTSVAKDLIDIVVKNKVW
ncbi:hypothetical protein AAMO2058_000374900 [Amorphochlora amoebiformis]